MVIGTMYFFFKFPVHNSLVKNEREWSYIAGWMISRPTWEIGVNGTHRHLQLKYRYAPWNMRSNLYCIMAVSLLKPWLLRGKKCKWWCLHLPNAQHVRSGIVWGLLKWFQYTVLGFVVTNCSIIRNPEAIWFRTCHPVNYSRSIRCRFHWSESHRNPCHGLDGWQRISV